MKFEIQLKIKQQQQECEVPPAALLFWKRFLYVADSCDIVHAYVVELGKDN
jgi:hypothetical protein